jgi:hypothetical protein
MGVDGTPMEEIKAFHREHHRAIVDEIIRFESTLEGQKELRALVEQIRDSCNGRPTMV